MNELPILEDCNGCGACCMEMDSPPGYAAFLTSSGQEFYPTDDEDLLRFQNLPKDALDALEKYHNDMKAGNATEEGPCCWLDEKTRQCRWYEHRPSVCREFPVGCGACLNWRDQFGVGMEADCP